MPSTDWSFFDTPATAVLDNMATMNGRADDAITTSNAVVDALALVTTDPEAAAPTVDLPDITIQDPVLTVQAIRTNALDSSLGPPASVSYSDLWGALGLTEPNVTFPDFSPTTGAMSMPSTPSAIDTSGLPSSPTLNDVVIPDAPDLTLPTMGDLIAISIPDFTFPTLPTFTDTAPAFTDSDPSTIPNFSEPSYSSALLNDTRDRIIAMLAGGTGIPTAVQNALFDKARDREIVTARMAEEDAFDTYAGRNFSMPPGMLVAQVNAAQEKSRMAQNELERQILITASDLEQKNLQFSVAQGIALETLLQGQFNNVAQRSFEAAKERLSADIALFNAHVSVFNARTSAYQTAAQVFKIKIDAALSELEVFKAQIQGEIAKGELNKSTVAVFQARVDAVKAVAELFKVKMEGAQVESDVNKTIIEGYKASIEAYAARIGADKTRFEAYGEQVKAEATKATALEAEARAYAATIEGASAKNNAKIEYIKARLSAVSASVEKFRAGLEDERIHVQQQLEEIQAQATSLQADTGRFTAETNANTEAQRTSLLVTEARLRNNLAFFETSMHEYDARMSRLLQQVTLKVEGLKAAGQIASTLASGAMAAIHVSAGISGSGSQSGTNNYSVTHNFQDS